MSRIYELLKKYVPREKDEITGLWSLNAGTPFSSMKSYLILHGDGTFEIHNPTKRADEWLYTNNREKMRLSEIKILESQKCKRIIIGYCTYSTNFVQMYGNNEYKCSCILC